MAESKAAWERVGEDFRALGRQVKQHYDQRDRPEGAGDPQAGAPAGAPVDQAGSEQPRAGAQGDRPEAAGGGGRPAPDRRKVDEALQKLSEALDQAFTALGDAVRDPQVGEQTKKAASSLSDALTATFAEASERFRKR
jgi:hypothetical protein